MKPTKRRRPQHARLPSLEACQRAIIRLLWKSVADNAACTCEPGDPCAECEAIRALGYARWVDARDAKRCLAAFGRAFALCDACGKPGVIGGPP